MAAQPRAGGSRAFAIVLVTVCLPSLVAGATLVVDASLPAAPATYQNLTAAVAAASNGDTVLVRPGVYSGAANSGIAFTDAKTLIVQGEGGWGDVIIDCAGANRAFSYVGSDASRVGDNWLRGLTIRNCAAANGGGIYADGLSVNVLDVAFLDVSALGVQFGIDGQGGAVYARSTNSSFRNVLFQHVRHAFGGVFAAGTDSSRYNNVTFRDMAAVEFGGAFIPEQQSASVLEDCVFENNYAPFGACVDTGGTSTTTFRRVTFRNNKAARGAGVYHYGNSKSKFYDCVFESNVGTNSGGGMECGTQTAPVFYNSKFLSNTATGQGGAMRTSGTSTPTFIGCYFFNNSAPRGGVGSNGGLSTVTFQGCVFDSNRATLLGGALECQGDSAVAIDQCTFRKNTAFRGGGLFQDGPVPWVITNTLFEDNTAITGGGFVCEGSSIVRFSNVTVRNNHATRDGGGAYAGFDTRVTLSNSHFEGNTCASSGGGLFIADTAVVTVLDTVFKDNAAGIDGGGVAVSAQANLTRCTFVGNEATADSGGGLYLAHTTTEQCERTTLQGLKFTGNRAPRGGGGGVFYTWALLTTGFRRLTPAAGGVAQPCIPPCTDCTFFGNTAVYGAAVATPTLELHVSAGTLLNGRALPLVPFNATVRTRDYFGNTVSQATGMRVVASLAPASSSACRLPAPPIVGVSQGVASFTSIAVGASPATTCTLVFAAEPKEAGLPADLSVSVELDACHVGYAAVGSSADYHCKECASGSYNVNGDGICYACGKGLICPGGSTLLVSQDHWPYRANQSGVVEAFQCPPNFCCQQESCPVTSPCAQHRDGFLCGTCFQGYAEVAGACVPCSGTNYSFIATVVVLAVLFAILNVLLERNDSNPLLSQVTFFCQVAVLIIPASEMRATAGSFSSILDLDMAGIFEAYDRVAGDSSSTCIAQWTGLSMTAAFYAVPCLLFASLGCVWLVHWAYHKFMHHRNMAALASRAQAAARSDAGQGGSSNAERLSVVLHDTVDGAVYGSRFPARLYTAAAFRLVLLSYSVVSDAALQLVSCHSPLGESVMVSQPSVACWTGHHTIWGVVSWLLVVFWVIGLPVAIVAFLWVVKQGGPLYTEHNRLQYGILYDTYRPKRYWFVAVGLARRSAAVVVYALLFNSGLARQFALFLLILVFLMAHVHMKPYGRHYDNVVETGLLMVLTVLCATMLARDALPSDQQEDSKYSFLIITQATMGILVAVWMVFAFGMIVVQYRRRKVKQVHTQRAQGTKLSPMRRLCACVLCIGQPPLHKRTAGAPEPSVSSASATTVNLAFQAAGTDAGGRGTRPANKERGGGARRGPAASGAVPAGGAPRARPAKADAPRSSSAAGPGARGRSAQLSASAAAARSKSHGDTARRGTEMVEWH